MNCSWRFGTDKRTDELKIDRTTNKEENVVTLDREAGEEEIFIINLLHQACKTGSKLPTPLVARFFCFFCLFFFQWTVHIKESKHATIWPSVLFFWLPVSHLSRDYFSFIARLFLIYRAIIFNFSNFRHRGLTLELEEAILLSDAEPLTRDPLVDLSFSIKCFLFSMSLFSPFFSFLSQNRRSPFVCNPSYIRKNSGQYITAEPSILNKNT